MNFCYSIDLHSNTTFRQRPDLMFMLEEVSHQAMVLNEQSKDKDHQRTETTS